MAYAANYIIGANDEHGQNPPTAGKRTPIMPYVNRSFYENEFNRPAKYYFLIAALRTGFNVYDVKPEFYDVSISERVMRVNYQNLTCLVTYAYNAIGNDLAFSNTNGHLVFYSNENQFAKNSRLLAYDVSSGLNGQIQTKDLGIGTLYNIGMLRAVRCPAVVAECGFMTNFYEAKLMMDPDFQANCADGGCIGVCQYLDVPYISYTNSADMATIRYGMRGNVVKFLQCYLNLYGNSLIVDGIFGGGTLAAVQKFQRDNSLSIDGIVGKNTWRTLMRQDKLPLLRYGSRGVYCRYAQQKLLSKLYPTGTIDGIFGANTQNAVIQFQQENGLSPDGIIGPLTWAKLTPIGGGREMP